MYKIKLMNKLIIFVIAILNLGTAVAQDWQTDFAVAKERAVLENKPIILVFQGSDWCAPCIKLDREVWGTEYFKTYAKDHFIMLKADFPRKKTNALPDMQTQANAKLAEIYNKNGYFPFVVMLDSEGKVLGETGYKKNSPEEYTNELNAFIKPF